MTHLRLKDYMALPYKMEITPDVKEGGFVIKFPELPGCLSCCDEWKDVQYMAQDAKLCYLQTAIEDGAPIPLPEGY